MKKNESTARLGFIWDGELVGPDGQVLQRGRTKNVIPQVGINHIVSLIRGQGTPVSGWFIGLGEADYVPGRLTDASVLQSAVGETQAYSEETRQPWDDSFDGESIITNLDSRAEFSFTAAKRVYTGFLVSNHVKGSASGVLLSIARFSTPYDIPSGSTFRLAVSINVLPAL